MLNKKLSEEQFGSPGSMTPGGKGAPWIPGTNILVTGNTGLPLKVKKAGSELNSHDLIF